MFPPGNNDDYVGPPQPPDYLDPSWTGAADDVVTTTDDIYNYYDQQQAGLQGGGPFIHHHQLGQTSPLLYTTPTSIPPPSIFSAAALNDHNPGGGHHGHDQLDDDDNEKEKKKVNRKEIERLRRKHMSTLHSSLVSLLPHRHLKGKRSISDHMGEAVNYIKHLESNIGELSSKRDKLKGSVDQQQLTNPDSCVTVRPHSAGVEVVVSSGGGEKGFELSRVVEAVIEQGFDVTSCVSTRRHGRCYHTMQCQASSERIGYIDVPRLQQKLNQVLLS